MRLKLVLRILPSGEIALALVANIQARPPVKARACSLPPPALDVPGIEVAS